MLNVLLCLDPSGGQSSSRSNRSAASVVPMHSSSKYKNPPVLCIREEISALHITLSQNRMNPATIGEHTEALGEWYCQHLPQPSSNVNW
jgi:hypothetical protein